MKAAIQGHTRCAKALLLAGTLTSIKSIYPTIQSNFNHIFRFHVGASPMETDYKRQLRAEQWARFCGRHSCSEVIEKCSRNRPADKDKSNDSSTVTDERFSVKVRARANSAVQTTSKVSTTIVTTNSKTNNDSGMEILCHRIVNHSIYIPSIRSLIYVVHHVATPSIHRLLFFPSLSPIRRYPFETFKSI